MIPTKNKEWYEFITEEGENIYESYYLKHVLSFHKKYSTAVFLFFEGCRVFSMSRKKKESIQNHKVEKAKKLCYRR